MYRLQSHQLVIFVQIDAQTIQRCVKMEGLVTIPFHHINVSALQDSQELTVNSVSSHNSYT